MGAKLPPSQGLEPGPQRAGSRRRGHCDQALKADLRRGQPLIVDPLSSAGTIAAAGPDAGETSEITIDPEFKAFAGALRPEERVQLEANLVADGRALDPLVVWRTEGGPVLIDGHHRLEICREHNLSFEIRELEFAGRDDVLIWIASHQAGRRNWTDSTFAYHLGKLYEARKRQGARTDLTSPQCEEKLTAAQQIATERGVSRATVERAAAFARAVDRIADVAGSAARDTILDERIDATREDVIDLADRPAVISQVFGEVKPTGGRVRHFLRDARRLDKFGRLRQQGTPGPGANWRKFTILLCDPPWPYECQPTNGSVDGAYPVMSMEELIDLRYSLNLDDHLTRDCVMFMWAPQPLLKKAFELIDGWGFTYKTGLVWIKSRASLGNYVRVGHELLLLATRGSLTSLESSRPCSVFEGKPWSQGLHSAKPDTQYEIIEQMYPGMARLELFARQRRPGWVSWGNELPVDRRNVEREEGRA